MVDVSTCEPVTHTTLKYLAYTGLGNLKAPVDTTPGIEPGPVRITSHVIRSIEDSTDTVEGIAEKTFVISISFTHLAGPDIVKIIASPAFNREGPVIRAGGFKRVELDVKVPSLLGEAWNEAS